jgi:hypothetical protein
MVIFQKKFCVPILLLLFPQFFSVCFETVLFVSVVSIWIRNTETNRKNNLLVSRNKPKQAEFRFVSVRTEKYLCLFRGHPSCTFRLNRNIRNKHFLLNCIMIFFYITLNNVDKSSLPFIYTIYLLFFGLFLFIFLCFGSIEKPKHAVSILNRNNRNQYRILFRIVSKLVWVPFSVVSNRN